MINYLFVCIQTKFLGVAKIMTNHDKLLLLFMAEVILHIIISWYVDVFYTWNLSRFITIFAKYENSIVQLYGLSIPYYGHK